MDEYLNSLPVVPEQRSQELTISMNKGNRGELPMYWDAEYITERIERITQPVYQTLYRFLWMTGCRITEALNVRKGDLDLQHYTVKIRWLKSRKWHTRTIPLHPRLRDILQVFTASLLSEDRLFPFTRQNAYKIIKRDFGGNPHRFRHSFAVHWLRQGGKIEVLCQMLGHSSIHTTLIYQRIVPSDIGQELLKITF